MKISPGRVLRIPEDDYCYGTGTIVIRVTEVVEEIHPKLEWVRIKGVEVLWNGGDGPVRDVLVRVSALRSASGCT